MWSGWKETAERRGEEGLPHGNGRGSSAPLMIVIENYRQNWSSDFQIIRRELAGLLGKQALQIDHIGSTSVPEMAAKDIIDVQITVAALDEGIARVLVDAGYVWRPALAHDHVPAGAEADPAMWSKMFFKAPPDRRAANVHVRVRGALNQRYPLLFRDYLRAHPRSARSMAMIKRELAKRHPNDEDAYYDVKDPVCDLVWEAALAWARQSDWEPAEA